RQERLLGNERLRFAGYRCVVKIWLAGSGSIERTELVGSCGSDEIDSTVRSVLADTSLRQSPPADLPQPVRIRLDSRRSG
ncbi:MAG: TonB C-terminal domain-containing protein, partial [Burkholderiales bacterium]|nr:TonB C-terminal domain-containing protein [Burkholderiales bacterium]